MYIYVEFYQTFDLVFLLIYALRNQGMRKFVQKFGILNNVKGEEGERGKGVRLS